MKEFTSWAWAMGCAACAACAPAAHEPLAAAPAEAGWHSLFEGSSLAEWRGYCQEAVPERWVADGGALHLTVGGAAPSGALGGGDLVTRAEYENFELTLEWKISEGGNSGIFYLAPEACAEGGGPRAPIYEAAPEMQVLDNERHPDARLGVNGNRQAGALYDLIPAVPQNARPAGEWNRAEITVDHGHVTHRQNGVVVLAYELESDSWKALVAASKFKDYPGFAPPARKGHIGLQDHGNEVWYRDLRVRDL